MPNKPSVTFNIVPRVGLQDLEDQKVLFVGQLISGGSATPGALVTNIGRSGEENALFGRRSALASMIRAARAVNPVTRFDAIGVSDGGSAVKGTCVVTFSGTATSAGTIVVGIAGYNYSIDVASGDTAAQVATKLNTAITANLDAQYTSAASVGAVTCTAANGGTLCNSWTVAYSGGAGGITIALTGWTGGATDPTITNVLDAIGETRYQTIVWPEVFSNTVVETMLNSRFNATNNVLDGVAITSEMDTLADLKTVASGLNSQSMVVLGLNPQSGALIKGNNMITTPDDSASVVGALKSIRLTDGANISNYVISSGALLDRIGGAALSTLPYFNTPMPGVLQYSNAVDWTLEEQDELAEAGISTFGYNVAGTEVILGEMVTTYLTNSAGDSDDSFHFLNTVDASSTVREFFARNFRATYRQFRLTNGDLIAGRAMANTGSLRAFCVRLYGELADLAVTQAGAEAVQDFKDGLTVTIDLIKGQATITASPLLVSQLRAIIGELAINFGG